MRYPLDFPVRWAGQLFERLAFSLPAQSRRAGWHCDHTAPALGHLESGQERGDLHTSQLPSALHQKSAQIESPGSNRRAFPSADCIRQLKDSVWDTVELGERFRNTESKLGTRSQADMTGHSLVNDYVNELWQTVVGQEALSEFQGSRRVRTLRGESCSRLRFEQQRRARNGGAQPSEVAAQPTP